MRSEWQWARRVRKSSSLLEEEEATTVVKTRTRDHRAVRRKDILEVLFFLVEKCHDAKHDFVFPSPRD